MSSPAAPTEPTPAIIKGQDTARPIAQTRLLGLIVLVVICLGALMLSMMVGSRSIDPAEIMHFLLHPDPADPLSQVVWQSRVPRTFLVLVAGSALGVAGGLMQAVTRNPMTDPGILGVNAGASLLVVIGLAFFGVTDISHYMWWSFA
ncbi:iron chelate uptake ABC transporter family permease subunit, partial [Corynebacterium stationis]